MAQRPAAPSGILRELALDGRLRRVNGCLAMALCCRKEKLDGIIVAQENAEGVGGPEFTELIMSQDSLEEFMERAFSGHQCSIDQWQLQEMHKVCRHSSVVSVCGGIPAEVQRELFVEPAESVEAAVAEALRQHGPEATIAVIPEGPYVMAEVA